MRAKIPRESDIGARENRTPKQAQEKDRNEESDAEEEDRNALEGPQMGLGLL
jgi:hypothetical protein